MKPESSPSAKPYTAFVCSHTHWDREWYGSFQQFRFRLVRLIDDLLELLERDPEFRHFNLDGQTIVLEDYLEIRPERRAELERQIAAGRITVGPWHILPDEFLVSGEATIRNLAKGRRMSLQHGGGPSRVGYLPDMFGHVSQMPQLLRGVGLDNAIVWRGISDPDLKSEFIWEAPDGSEVLAMRLPEYCGYCNAGFFWASLPESTRRRLGGQHGGLEEFAGDVDLVLDVLPDIVDELKSQSACHALLLMNGIDHMPPQPTIPEIVRRANERFPDVRFVHARFDDYVDAVRAELAGRPLQRRRGELKDTAWRPGASNFILPNILSARVYLKQQNAECQNLLAFWAEPTCVMAELHACPDRRAFLDRAWTWLIQNHPHDSIGGCSADPIHEQMETRFAWAREIAEEVTLNNLSDLASRVDTRVLADGEQALLVVNPLPWERGGTFRLSFWLTESYLRGRPGAGEFNPENPFAGWRNLRLLDDRGQPVAHQLVDLRLATECHTFLSGFAAAETVARATVEVALDRVPAAGGRLLRVSPDPVKQLVPGRLVTGPRTIENEHLRVTVEPSGTLALTDKVTGRTWAGLGAFEDGGDNGDGYNYSPPRFDAVHTTIGQRPQVAMVADGPVLAAFEIRHRWELPVGLDATRQRRAEATAPLEIVSRVELGVADRLVRVTTRVLNTHRNHRLRVLFPTWLAADTCAADSQFDVIERPVHVPQPPRDVWIEDQPRQYPQQTFCAIGDGAAGLAVFSRGLHEFEVADRPDRALMITLLRAVGFLAAGMDLNTIRGGAGPSIETPGGQCLRPLEFHYAICPFTGSHAEAGLPRRALEWTVGVRAFPTGQHAGTIPAGFSLLALEGDPNVMVSALKPPEQGGEPGLVLRLWNPAVAAAAGRVRLAAAPRRAEWTDLLEENAQPAAVESNPASVPFQLGPKQIRTLKLLL